MIRPGKYLPKKKKHAHPPQTDTNSTFTVYFIWNQLPYVSPLPTLPPLFGDLALWFIRPFSHAIWSTHRPCTHAHHPEGQSKANQSDHLWSESPAEFPAFLGIHSKMLGFSPKKMRKFQRKKVSSPVDWGGWVFAINLQSNFWTLKQY